MTEEVRTREKHPGRVAQGHRLAALMKKRKEEILHNKGQSTEQPTEQPIVKSTAQSTVQSKLCLQHWDTCCTCHRCLRIFCIQQEGRTSHP